MRFGGLKETWLAIRMNRLGDDAISASLPNARPETATIGP